MKEYINEVVSIRYTDRDESIEGIVIDYNDDWTLLKYNPNDYWIDGYKIIRHKNIEGFVQGEVEFLKQKVFKLKGIEITKNTAFELKNLEEILTYITNKYLIFQIETKSETACYIGSLSSYSSKKLEIKSVTPYGEWSNIMSFRPGDVRTIEFETDYLKSLKLLIDNK